MKKLLRISIASVIFIIIIISSIVHAKMPPPPYDDPGFQNIEELIEWIETVDAESFQSGRFKYGLLFMREQGQIYIPYLATPDIDISSVTVRFLSRSGPRHEGNMSISFRIQTPEGQLLVRISYITPHLSNLYKEHGIAAYFNRTLARSYESYQILEGNTSILCSQTGERINHNFLYVQVDEISNPPTPVENPVLPPGGRPLLTPAPIILNTFIMDGVVFRVSYWNIANNAFFEDLTWVTHPITDRSPQVTATGTNQQNHPTTTQPTRNTIRFTIASPTYTINTTPHTTGAPPFLCPAYNRTMLPLRTVSEALGTEVDWIPETRTVQIFTPGGIHEIAVDMPLHNNMGTPVLIQDRVFVPLRYIAELLNATPRWDGDNMAAYVYQYVTQR